MSDLVIPSFYLVKCNPTWKVLQVITISSHISIIIQKLMVFLFYSFQTSDRAGCFGCRKREAGPDAASSGVPAAKLPTGFQTNNGGHGGPTHHPTHNLQHLGGGHHPISHHGPPPGT